MEPGAGGREGPKSSSEEELDASSFSSAFGDGFVGGSSESGAGGGAGPMMRLRVCSLELADELRGRLGGMGWASSSSSAFRFRLARRWGGSSGPTVDMLGGIMSFVFF